MTETVLEMCQRHVAEGAQRITRQKALISELSCDGREQMVRDAYVLLGLLETSQQLGEQHLAREAARTGKDAVFTGGEEPGVKLRKTETPGGTHDRADH